MKRCPKCYKTYDNTWGICLSDGNALTEVGDINFKESKVTPDIREIIGTQSLIVKDWNKKVLALILDFVIFFVFALVTRLIFGAMIYVYCLSNNISRSNINAQQMASADVLLKLIYVLTLIAYFYWLPKILGNTCARKILKIEDKWKRKNLFQCIDIINANTFGKKKT